MPKKRVYVESSVISYLTARPARDLIMLARQLETADWWEQREKWDLYISTLVMTEIEKGDPGAADKRIAAVEGLPQLNVTDEARELARTLIAKGAIPGKAFDDALHIAVAAINKMDCLLTWNQRHIYNPETLEILYTTLRSTGHTPPMLARPDNFFGGL